MRDQKKLYLILTILWAIGAICFLICTLINFTTGIYYLAIIYMVAFSLDGINAIMAFIQWRHYLFIKS